MDLLWGTESQRFPERYEIGFRSISDLIEVSIFIWSGFCLELTCLILNSSITKGLYLTCTHLLKEFCAGCFSTAYCGWFIED